MRLTSHDLQTKFGFEDGDILTNAKPPLREPNCIWPSDEIKWKHRVLIILVTRHLQQYLPPSWKLVEYNTHHNPIREVAYNLAERFAPSSIITVEVSAEQIEAAAKEAEALYAPH